MSTPRHGPPVRRITHLLDIAAHAQAFAPPHIVWRQLLGPSRVPAPSPALMFGGAEAAVARQLFGQIDIAAAGCFAMTDAAIGPGGVIIKDSTAFFGATLGTPEAQAAIIAHRLNACAATTCVAPGAAASLFGAANDRLSLLTEVMPALWIIAAAGYTDLLYVPIPAEAHPDARPMLLAAGLSASQLLPCDTIDSVFRSPRVLAPARLGHGVRFSPLMGEATRFWTTKLRATLGVAPPKPQRPLFLSPRDGDEPEVADWQSIEAAAAERGLTIFHPEGLSLAERTATYSEAKYVLGFDGAALMEACIFAPPGIPVCAIRGNSTASARLPGLAAALDHKFGTIFARTDSDNPDAPVQVHGGDVQRAITAMSLMAS